MNDLIKKISGDLRLDYDYLVGIVNRANYYYKTYPIKKKNGGERWIAQPSPELKTLQYWVVDRILCNYPVSESAFAYNKGDSIKKHAEFHKNARHFFHTDIVHFFFLFNSKMLDRILKKNLEPLSQIIDHPEEVIDTVCKICFRFDRLCIGAVSSPRISNLVMYEFDSTLFDYCKKQGLRYSRYADDIYISSRKYIPKDILEYVDTLLSSQGLKQNWEKTWFCSHKNRCNITGLIITDEQTVSVGTETRSKIKKQLYDKLIHGRGDEKSILGYLSFLKDIEPDTYNKLIIKYSGYCEGDILDALKDPLSETTIVIPK